MATPMRAAVTLETLRNGCHQLGIPVPIAAKAKYLQEKIILELQKDKTYGSYACGACQCDIIDRIAMCPFCSARLMVAKVMAEELESLESATLTGDINTDALLEEDEEEGEIIDAVILEDLPTPGLIPAPKPKPSTQKKRKRPSKTSNEVRLAQRKKDRIAKREVIRKELPYSEDDLKLMKRVALVMVAGILTIKDPVKMDDTALVEAIVAKQSILYPTG